MLVLLNQYAKIFSDITPQCCQGPVMNWVPCAPQALVTAHAIVSELRKAGYIVARQSAENLIMKSSRQ